MNWLHYLLEANLYLAVFYAGYYLFLSRETYYTLNRFYLLFGSVVSFILPVMQLGMLKPTVQPNNTVHFIYTTTAVTTSLPVHTAAVTPAYTLQDAVLYGYLLGAMILFLVLLFKLYQLLKLTRLQDRVPARRYKIVYLNQSDTAFSFFNYLFIGTKVEQREMIIKHELVHIRQKHSADVIFIELLKIVNWFNPFIYLMQHSLRAIHEYIADEKTATADTDTITYSSFLVNNAYGLSGSSITHSFFNYNLLKKRIIMLHQKRSGSLARLKYLLAIPICAGLLCASTLAFSKTYGWIDVAPHHLNYADTVRHAHIIRDTDKTHIPPPPPPAPPVKRVKFPLPKTSKGYSFSEYGYTENGKSDIVVTIHEKDGSHKEYDKNKANAAELALLKEKYGYVFPSHLRVPPPPPPVVVPDGKTPPPPPPAPPKPTAYTKKGYKYSEDGYLINGKTDFRVIIFKKDGNQLAFFKSKASADDINLLKDKYGYTFPVMDIHTKMPPPPPEAPKVTSLAPSNDSTLKDPFSKFDMQLAKVIRYPAKARENKYAGRVIVNFTVGADNKIQDIVVLRGPAQSINDEVARAIQTCDTSPFEPGARYTLPVTFTIMDKSGHYVGDSDPSFEKSSYKAYAKRIPGPGSIQMGEVVVVGYLN